MLHAISPIASVCARACAMHSAWKILCYPPVILIRLKYMFHLLNSVFLKSWSRHSMSFAYITPNEMANHEPSWAYITHIHVHTIVCSFCVYIFFSSFSLFNSVEPSVYYVHHLFMHTHGSWHMYPSSFVCSLLYCIYSSIKKKAGKRSFFLPKTR